MSDAHCLPFWGRKKSRKITVVLLGLDNAGKTTLMNTLKGDYGQSTTATFGFNRDVIQEGPHRLEVFDLGGGQRIRRIWRVYLAEVHAAVFVVDASDPSRLELCRSVLHETLRDPHLVGKPLLVLANKQDAPGALATDALTAELGLDDHTDNRYVVVPCVARTEADSPPDARISEGLRWLTCAVEKAWGRLSARVAAEAKAARQEEEKKKKEREQRAMVARDERLKAEAAEASAKAAAGPASPAAAAAATAPAHSNGHTPAKTTPAAATAAASPAAPLMSSQRLIIDLGEPAAPGSSGKAPLPGGVPSPAAASVDSPDAQAMAVVTNEFRSPSSMGMHASGQASSAMLKIGLPGGVAD